MSVLVLVRHTRCPLASQGVDPWEHVPVLGCSGIGCRELSGIPETYQKYNGIVGPCQAWHRLHVETRKV